MCAGHSEGQRDEVAMQGTHPASRVGEGSAWPCGMVDSPAWGEALDAQQLRGSTSKKKGGRFLLPEAGDVARASWSCV